MNRPSIRSREDLIAFYTHGEDPAMVPRYSEGPEEELIGLSRQGLPPDRVPRGTWTGISLRL